MFVLRSAQQKSYGVKP